MVAKSILTPSASPPAGWQRMTDEQAVREWLTSFGGAIAEANYYSVLADAGFDSLANMIFTSDQLLDSVEGDIIKVGHAIRIARDAEQMILEIGSIGYKTPPGPSDTEAQGALLTGIDAKKVSGPPPDFPSSQGNQPLTREEMEGWIR